MIRTVTLRPRQHTEYVVRSTESDNGPVVYRGDSATAVRHVCRQYPDATVTFRSEAGLREYLETR